MPNRVQKRGSKYVVTDGKRVFGTHDSRSAAEAQRRAIAANSKKGTRTRGK